MSGVDREDVLERLRALDFAGHYNEARFQFIADDILALFAVPMEAVAWRLRRVGVTRWNLWDLDPRTDTPAYANADAWEVQALAVIPAPGAGTNEA